MSGWPRHPSRRTRFHPSRRSCSGRRPIVGGSCWPSQTRAGHAEPTARSDAGSPPFRPDQGHVPRAVVLVPPVLALALLLGGCGGRARRRGTPRRSCRLAESSSAKHGTGGRSRVRRAEGGECRRMTPSSRSPPSRPAGRSVQVETHQCRRPCGHLPCPSSQDPGQEAPSSARSSASRPTDESRWHAGRPRRSSHGPCSPLAGSSSSRGTVGALRRIAPAAALSACRPGRPAGGGVPDDLRVCRRSPATTSRAGRRTRSSWPRSSSGPPVEDRAPRTPTCRPTPRPPAHCQQLTGRKVAGSRRAGSGGTPATTSSAARSRTPEHRHRGNHSHAGRGWTHGQGITFGQPHRARVGGAQRHRPLVEVDRVGHQRQAPRRGARCGPGHAPSFRSHGSPKGVWTITEVEEGRSFTREQNGTRRTRPCRLGLPSSCVRLAWSNRPAGWASSSGGCTRG